MREKLQDFSIIATFAIFIMSIFICFKLITLTDTYESEIIGYREPEISSVAFIAEESAAKVNNEHEEIKETMVRVYISGEVKNPGVYEIEESKRMVDLIELAGGATEDANIEGLNLAAFVQDGKHVKVPKMGEEIEAEETEEEQEAKAQSSSASNGTDKPVYSGPVNINTADSGRLTSLPGIGPAIAQNIIDYRNANGGFKSIEEIKKVNRIGDATFNQIKDKITVE